MCLLGLDNKAQAKKLRDMLCFVGEHPLHATYPTNNVVTFRPQAGLSWPEILVLQNVEKTSR
jgi:hypothetical protein